MSHWAVGRKGAVIFREWSIKCHSNRYIMPLPWLIYWDFIASLSVHCSSTFNAGGNLPDHYKKKTRRIGRGLSTQSGDWGGGGGWGVWRGWHLFRKIKNRRNISTVYNCRREKPHAASYPGAKSFAGRVYVTRLPSEPLALLLLLSLFWKAVAAAASILGDSGSRCQVHFSAQEQHFWGKNGNDPNHGRTARMIFAPLQL